MACYQVVTVVEPPPCWTTLNPVVTLKRKPVNNNWMC